MPYGTLTPTMISTLRPYVEGREVYDLGAGDGGHARTLIHECRASFVVAIDKEPRYASTAEPKIQRVFGYFAEVRIPPVVDVAFIGWPVNYPAPGLIDWLKQSSVVAYLGCNDGMTACGHPSLFQYLLRRSLLAYVPHRKNTLVIVGDYLPNGEVRMPTHEETCGLTIEGAM